MPETTGRKTILIVAGTLSAVLAVLIFWQVSLNVGIQPTDSEQTFLLFVLATLVSLAFLVFAFILTRSVLKLYLERRANQLGSKFKTKLVIGALALSLLPVFFLYYFSYVLTSRTLNRWFTLPIASVTRQTRDMVAQINSYPMKDTELNTAALSLASLGETLRAGKRDKVEQILELEAKRQVVDYLAVEVNNESWGAYPSALALAKELPLEDRRARRPLTRLLTKNKVAYAVAVMPIDPNRVPHPSGWIIAANELPEGLMTTLAQVNREQETYDRIYYENKSVRSIYTAIQALVTILILFISTWVALQLSKQVTVPIEALAEGTHQAALGNLGYRIGTHANDELGVLVRSFNDMMRQLEESGAELERRRRETEALLESIPTPVISLTRDRRVLRVNPAVERMFGAERARGATLRDVVGGFLGPEDHRELEHLLRRSLRRGLASGQFELTAMGKQLSVAVTVSALHGSKATPSTVANDIAYIVVIEDLSDLLHAQQAQAWREVAQRVAHEIKNPLTPITLSVERIRRRIDMLQQGGKLEEQADARQVVADCLALIEQEVGTLKTLVGEFSQLARFPKAHLEPDNLNGIVEGAIAVFDGRLDGIDIHLDLAQDLPPVNVDREQFKSVIVNLVDNAAEAMESSLLKELRISTARVPSSAGEFVEVVVSDTGPGVSPELKERLFLPHFSTKKRGTGLGLAIVSRILSEHRGSVRVEENGPVGARFIVEIPV